jgi:hypothetical protein
MFELLADPTPPDQRAAAIARHPAGRIRAQPVPLTFAAVVELLTGPWRVGDPDSFAAAMTSAPVIAGYPVLDLTGGGAAPEVRLDPWSAVVLGSVEAAVSRAFRSPRLAVEWVAGSHAGHLYVEARGMLPGGPDGPAVFVLAHVVEEVGPAGRRPGRVEHSWAVLVAGDGRGGVTGVARVILSCPARIRCCPPPAGGISFLVAGFREGLLAPALAAQSGGSGPAVAPSALVLPFRRAPV